MARKPTTLANDDSIDAARPPSPEPLPPGAEAEDDIEKPHKTCSDGRTEGGGKNEVA